MNFSRKVFLAIFCSTLVVCTSLIYLAHHFVEKRTRQSYINRYVSISDVLGNTINQLEKNTESLMHNAAQVIFYEDKINGALPTEKLSAMRNDLNVTHLFTINTSGKFIRSTNESPDLIPNLYSFCGKYRDLVSGNEKMMVTPIIPPKPEPQPYKFLTIPNYNHSRLIHVGVRVDFLKNALSTTLSNDRNIQALNIYAPDGTSLGSFSENQFSLNQNKIELPKNYGYSSSENGTMRFFTKVASTETSCCQCDVAGISKNGNYYYVIESVVSDKELVATLRSLKILFAVLLATALFFAIFTARWLSGKLANRIQTVSKRIEDMGNTGDLSARIGIRGKDEIGYLAREFDSLLDKLESSQKELITTQRQAALGEMAREVAHNINSPLLSIQNSIRLVDGPEGILKTLKNAVNEIKNHVGALRSKAGHNSIADSPVATTISVKKLNPKDHLVFTTLDDIISEKRLQNKHQDFEITYDVSLESKSAFVKFDLTEFRSVISNLINNATEASSSQGEIKIELSVIENHVTINIADSGKGIAPEVLSNIFKNGFTHGKEGGTGIGLYHAKNQIENMGGTIVVESKVGTGTTVTINIPRVSTPEWFISSVDFSKYNSVVILDDNESIHDLWKSKINNKQIHSFLNIDELESWIKSNNASKNSDSVFLIDYDLRSEKSGINIIERNSISPHSILVTNEFTDQNMIAKASWIGLKILPKPLI